MEAVSDEELFKFLANEDDFFRKRMEKKFPNLLDFKSEYETWKQYYIKTIRDIGLLKEKYSFDYTKNLKSPPVHYLKNSKILEKKLYHLTSLEGLYNILSSGYLKSRNLTGAKVGFSPANNQNSGNWIYLSMNETLPKPGNINVQLVFSSSLLIERKDYFLNYEWSYGKIDSSLGPEKINEFIDIQTPYKSEIIFKDPIPLDDYLLQINVVQLPANLIQKIPEGYRPQFLNLEKIPERYRVLIKNYENL